ncbi:MAG: Gfo/Idh/MocA family oxidoreductase [Bacteroidota bacterium]|nr:Gfo/Idh/MocA family oxidoreductase [Bacteroidota bacterium]
MKQINWGIIGCGDVTEVKSGPAFNKVEHSRLVAVMRRDAAKAEDYALRHHVERWYSDAGQLINDPEVNAVYVATPPNTHAEYAIRVMRAGKPVYVEKPMAMNEAECREMIRVSKETGQRLYVAYYRRALPYFIKIKELIDAKVIGDVRLVDLKLHHPFKPEELHPELQKGWRVDPGISGGGHFHDLASHQLDFLLYLLGPVKQVKGISVNQAGLYAADDVTIAVMEFESGAVFTGSWCFTVPQSEAIDQAEIIGSKGKLTFSTFGKPVITIEKENGQVERLEIPYPQHVQHPNITLVVQSLLGIGETPSNGETGIEATILMDRITAKQK